MRVLITTPSVRPLGSRRSLVELVRHLPRHVEPMVVCPAPTGIYHDLKQCGVPVALAPQGAWRKLFGRMTAYVRQIPAMRRAMRGFQPDIVHANEYHIVPQTAGAAAGRLPLTAHIRQQFPAVHIGKYLLGRCRRIVAVSKAVRGIFPDEMRGRVTVVPNGVALSALSSAAAMPAILQQWREEGRLVVGQLGLISPNKNQLVAAEAVARACARGAHIGLFFAGDAFKGTEGYGQALRARLAQPDLAGCAEWLPFQDDPAPLYRAMDVNLLISTEEGFGRTIIEAGGLGVATIGTNAGGIPEVLDGGKCGWLVRAGEVEELAEVLMKLAGPRRGAVREAGDRMRQRVLQEFTIEAHTSRMVRLWEEVVAEAAGQTSGAVG